MIEKIPETINDKVKPIELYDNLHTKFTIEKKPSDEDVYIVTREWIDILTKNKFSDTLEIGKSDETDKDGNINYNLNVFFRSENQNQQNNNKLDQEKLQKRKEARKKDDVLSEDLIICNNILLNSIFIDLIGLALHGTIFEAISLGVLSIIHVFTGYYGTKSGENGRDRSEKGKEKSRNREKKYKEILKEIRVNINKIERFKSIKDDEITIILKKTLEEIEKYRNNKEKIEFTIFIEKLKKSLFLDLSRFIDKENKADQDQGEKDLEPLIYLLLETNYYHNCSDINRYDNMKHILKNILNFSGQYTGYFAIGCTIAALAIGAIVIFSIAPHGLTISLFVLKVVPLLLTMISNFISLVVTINSKFEWNRAKTKEVIAEIQYAMCTNNDYQLPQDYQHIRNNENKDIYERLRRCESYAEDRKNKYYNNRQELLSKIVISAFIIIPILSSQVTLLIHVFKTGGLWALKGVSLFIGFTLVATKRYNKRIAQLSNKILVDAKEANEIYSAVNRLYTADEKTIEADEKTIDQNDKQILNDGFRRLTRVYTKIDEEEVTVHTYSYAENFPKNTKPEWVRSVTNLLPFLGPIIGASYTAWISRSKISKSKNKISYLPPPLYGTINTKGLQINESYFSPQSVDSKVDEIPILKDDELLEHKEVEAKLLHKPVSSKIQKLVEVKQEDEKNSTKPIEIINKQDDDIIKPSEPPPPQQPASHKKEIIVKEMIDDIVSLTLKSVDEKKLVDNKISEPIAQPIEEDDTDNSIISQTDETDDEELKSIPKPDILKSEVQPFTDVVKTRLNVDNDGEVLLTIEPILKPKEEIKKMPILTELGILPACIAQAYDQSKEQESKCEQSSDSVHSDKAKCRSLENLRILLSKPKIQSEKRISKSAPVTPTTASMPITKSAGLSSSPIFSPIRRNSSISDELDNATQTQSSQGAESSTDTDSDESITKKTSRSPAYELIPTAEPIPNLYRRQSYPLLWINTMMHETIPRPHEPDLQPTHDIPVLSC